MANLLYASGREGYLAGDLAWDTDDVRVILVDDTADLPNLTTDDFLDDRTAGARIAVSGALTGKTTAAGVADAADVTWTAVSGAVSESIDCYKHTGTDATSRLIFNINVATGLPVTPNSGDITIQWDNTAARIFTL